MSAPSGSDIMECFAEMEDPRIDRTKRHELQDIIFIVICGVICGADNWVEIEAFGHAQEQWLKRFLALPNGIPSHDTFGRVFASLDAEQFQVCFERWIKSVSRTTAGEVIAIDGKTLRRSHDQAQGKSAIGMVSAWATANHLVLGQVKVQDKSNEITAIPELLRVLEINGCIVSIDAMGCQVDIARAILDRGGDYVLAVKRNQGRLFDDLQSLFKIEKAEAQPFNGVEYDYTQTVDKGHGRIETRQCWVVTDADYLAYIKDYKDWPGLRSLILVRGTRRIGEESTQEDRYYISSLEGDAPGCLQAVRSHWDIENSLHWVLDMAFREDESRVRSGNAAQNLAVVRHIAVSLLKQERTSRIGLHAKRLKAGWDEKYRLKVLFG